VAANEHLAQFVDMRELLEQVWDSGQIGKESPVFDEETMKKNQTGGAQQQAHADAMKAIQEVEHKAGEMIKQAQAQAEEAKRMEQFKRDELAAKEADSKRKHDLALHEALNKNVDQGHKSHLVEAQIDKLQAETLAALAKANEKPSPELEAKGTEAEGEKPDPLAGLAEMHGKTLEKQDKTLEALASLAEVMKRPRKLVRGPDGRAAGVE
jgi:hypothetical protein